MVYIFWIFPLFSSGDMCTKCPFLFVSTRCIVQNVLWIVLIKRTNLSVGVTAISTEMNASWKNWLAGKKCVKVSWFQNEFVKTRAALLTAGSNNTAHPTWVFFHFFFQRISRICHCSKVKFLTNPAWIANWLQLLVPDKSHKRLKQNESTKIVFIWICQINETNCISVL